MWIACDWARRSEGRPMTKKMIKRNILTLLWDRHFIEGVVTGDVYCFLVFTESDTRRAFGSLDEPGLFTLRVVTVNFPVSYVDVAGFISDRREFASFGKINQA